MTAKIPLRDRKKAKIRLALMTTSYRLFHQKGFNQTTLEEIAEECEVTVPTLLRYFASKEDLLFARHYDIMEGFKKGLSAAIEGASVVDYWRQFVRSSCVTVKGDAEISRSYQLIESNPALLARFHLITYQYQRILEDALCEEMGCEAGQDTHAMLLAHMLVEGPIEMAFRLISSGRFQDLDKRCLATIEYSLQNFKRPARAVVRPRSTGKQVRTAGSRN